MSDDEKKNEARRDPEGSPHRPVQRSRVQRSRRPEHRASPIPRGNVPLTEGERPAYGSMPFGDYDPYRRGNTTPVQRSPVQRPRRPVHRTSPIPRGNMPLSEGERPAYGSMPFDDYDPYRRDNTTPVQRSPVQRPRRPVHRTSPIPRGNMPFDDDDPMGLLDATPTRPRYPVRGPLHQPRDLYEEEALRQRYPPYDMYTGGALDHHPYPYPGPPLFGYGVQATAPGYFNPQGPYPYPYPGPPSIGYGMQGIAPGYFNPQGTYGMPSHLGPSYHGLQYPSHRYPRDYEDDMAWERRLDANRRRIETVDRLRRRQFRAWSRESVPADNGSSAEDRTSSDPPTYDDPPAYEDEVEMPTTRSQHGKGFKPRSDEHRRGPFHVTEDESRKGDLVEAPVKNPPAASEAQAGQSRRRKPATKKSRILKSQVHEQEATGNHDDQSSGQSPTQDSPHVEASSRRNDDQPSGQSPTQDSPHVEASSTHNDDQPSDQSVMQDSTHGHQGSKSRCSRTQSQKDTEALEMLVSGIRGTHIEGKPKRARYKCDNAGCIKSHLRRNCQLPWVCLGCGVRGHTQMDCRAYCTICGRGRHIASRCDFFNKDGHLSKVAVDWKRRMADLWIKELAKPPLERVDPTIAPTVNTQAPMQQVDDEEWEARMSKAQGRADGLKSKPSTREWADIDSDPSDSDSESSDAEDRSPPKEEDDQHDPSADH